MFGKKFVGSFLLAVALMFTICSSALAYSSLQIVNNSGSYARDVYFVSANSKTWGSSIGSISNGSSITLNLVPGVNWYSLRVESSNGATPF